MDESEASDTSFIEITTKIGNDSRNFDKHHTFSGHNEKSRFKSRTMVGINFEIESLKDHSKGDLRSHRRSQENEDNQSCSTGHQFIESRQNLRVNRITERYNENRIRKSCNGENYQIKLNYEQHESKALPNNANR